MDKETLKKNLSAKYQDSDSFLKNIIFPIFGEEEFESFNKKEYLKHHPERLKLAKSTGIELIKQVGRIYVGGTPLYIFDITVSDHVMMERNRVNIQKLIRSIIDQYSCAFMIFHYTDTTRCDWRFSYCHKREYKEEFTDSKRYTFLLGPDQSCRTAAENFMTLYTKRGNIQIDDIEMAFNVEALSKEFFTKYKKDHYKRFVEYMVNTPAIREDFIDRDFDRTNLSEEQIRDREEKPIRDYVKKLLGRIVFLHFLQKKGWLGVPEDKEWGEGDRNFMLHLFEYASVEQKGNFLDNVLEPLFSDGLDTDRINENYLFDTGVDGFNKIRIPYLNGGLFERDALDKKTCRFPSKLFDDLLTMFSQYNFTIDENDPNDAEVGIDPEMLGRIFENLLEDNKDKGAFYTPKEIVQYMCRESLIAYLQTDQTENNKEIIRQFVLTHDAEQLPEGLKIIINDKLKGVKICDPAIGSGAFPMGLLRELFLCRSDLETEAESNENYAAKVKREIIQNNIYGVDIEHGAVDIARLRFWLALVVDEKSPTTLPNLDFKIMQGNSLLESYKGVDLSNLIARETDIEIEVQTTIFDEDLDIMRKLLLEKITKYYGCYKHTERVKLRKEISNMVQKQIKAQHYEISMDNIDLYANDQFFLWHTWFCDVFSRPSKEGFDIVISNPPYIKEYTNKAAFDGFRETSPYYMGKMDLWYGFACHGLDLAVKQGGILCFIAQNNWTTSTGAKLLRDKIVKDCRIIQMIDFNDYMVFGESASIQTMIMLFVNDNKTDNYVIDYRYLKTDAKKQDMTDLLEKRQTEITKYLTPIFNRKLYEGKFITFSEVDDLLKKIGNGKTYMNDHEAINGIHPHYDFVNKKINRKHPQTIIGEGIFGLTEGELKKLDLNEKEKSLIKPYYTTTEIKRFYTFPHNKQWLIYTTSEYSNEHSMDAMPTLKKHLDRFRDVITSDNKPYGLHRARQIRFFNGKKIVVQRKCCGMPSFSYSDFPCFVSATFLMIIPQSTTKFSARGYVI